MSLACDLRAPAWYSGVGVEEAGRSGSPIVNIAVHSASRVRGSGGWIEAPAIVKMLDDEGHDKAWARFMRALDQ
eukprot:2924262-Pyramimonas_sp.AAC.1